jgi:PadR family transcriptional regulator, regulatory protein PadR
MIPTFDVQAFARALHELLVLARLRSGPLHGYQIALDVAERSGGRFDFRHGTLYPILHRLEQEGRIEGAWTEEKRPRKVYRLTAKGRRSLEEERRRCEEVFRGLFAVLDEEESDESGSRADRPA